MVLNYIWIAFFIIAIVVGLVRLVFFGDADYALYRDLLAASCKAAGVSCWAYVLMPNHIHAILGLR